MGEEAKAAGTNSISEGSTVDELFVGALVGATIGMSAMMLWADVRFALGYVPMAIIIHIVLADAPLVPTPTHRNALYALAVSLFLLSALYTATMHEVPLFELLVKPQASTGSISNALSARTLVGALLILPFYRLVSTLVRHQLVSRIPR